MKRGTREDINWRRVWLVALILYVALMQITCVMLSYRVV